MEKKYIIGFVIAVVALVGVIVFINNRNNGPVSAVDLNPLAICLKDKGATFYGAFWCPHCQATKRMFGNAKNQLPYVECSTADGQNQLPICKEKDIKSYPTWVFADGSRLTGEQTAQALAQKAGCPLPAGLEPLASSTPVSTSTSSSAAQ